MNIFAARKIYRIDRAAAWRGILDFSFGAAFGIALAVILVLGV